MSKNPPYWPHEDSQRLFNLANRLGRGEPLTDSERAELDALRERCAAVSAWVANGRAPLP